MPTRCAARAQQAAAQGADLVAFPELFIAGYPPEDLVLKPAFQAACRARGRGAGAREHEAARRCWSARPGSRTASSTTPTALLDGGAIEALRFKVDLPNYGVFDEKRVFAPGPMPGPILVKGVRIGIPICEDIWGPEVVECLAETGGEILLVPNGSPYWRGKTEHRLNIAVARVVEFGLPLIYLNKVGGQDELVFDGASFVLQRRPHARRAASGVPRDRGADANGGARQAAGAASSGPIAQVEKKARRPTTRACVLGLRDYVDKNGFKGVVLGLSGGIDSALVRRAWRWMRSGQERVRCVMLPYRFTSQESLDDAARVRQGARRAHTICCRSRAAVLGLEKSLAPAFAGQPRDVTEENLQARARGTILMAISNKFGLMVVTTGNKSEMSVGYATLYGDMNGGFNPIKDLYKTEVYRLSRLRNAWKPEGALGPERLGHPGEHHRQGADRGAAREPEGPGLAAALRRARPDPGAAGRARGADRSDRRSGLRPRNRDEGRAHAQRSPNTSAGRRRPASR